MIGSLLSEPRILASEEIVPFTLGEITTLFIFFFFDLAVFLSAFSGFYLLFDLLIFGLKVQYSFSSSSSLTRLDSYFLS